jgi:heme/copper-type cytochrome/quinol oxidase subunit 2
MTAGQLVGPLWLRRWVGWLLAILAVASILLVPLPDPTHAPATRVVRVNASSFEYAPSVIRVNPGAHVTLEVIATDVVHGLYLDGYDLSVTADPGQTGRLSFVADRPGVFRFRCSVTCGPLHPFMIGKLYVAGGPLWWRGLAALAVAASAGLLIGTKSWRAIT